MIKAVIANSLWLQNDAIFLQGLPLRSIAFYCVVTNTCYYVLNNDSLLYFVSLKEKHVRGCYDINTFFTLKWNMNFIKLTIPSCNLCYVPENSLLSNYLSGTLFLIRTYNHKTKN